MQLRSHAAVPVSEADLATNQALTATPAHGTEGEQFPQSAIDLRGECTSVRDPASTHSGHSCYCVIPETLILNPEYFCDPGHTAMRPRATASQTSPRGTSQACR